MESRDFLNAVCIGKTVLLKFEAEDMTIYNYDGKTPQGFEPIKMLFPITKALFVSEKYIIIDLRVPNINEQGQILIDYNPKKVTANKIKDIMKSLKKENEKLKAENEKLKANYEMVKPYIRQSCKTCKYEYKLDERNPCKYCRLIPYMTQWELMELEDK